MRDMLDRKGVFRRYDSSTLARLKLGRLSLAFRDQSCHCAMSKGKYSPLALSKSAATLLLRLGAPIILPLG